MNGETLRQNFIKVYRDNNIPINVFKAAHGFSLLCEAEPNSAAIGMGIAPNTYLGIRLCDEDSFYVRFPGSEMQYECSRNKLSEYSQNDCAEPIFKTIARLLKGNESISGAQLYFQCECDEEKFAEYKAVLVYGMGTILGMNTSGENLMKFIYPDTMNFSENARNIITLSSAENRCEAIEKTEISFFSLPFGGCKLVIGKTDTKPLKSVEYDEKKLDMGIAAYKGSDEYNKINYAINEKERFKQAKEALKHGEYARLGHIIRRSSCEYLSVVKKNGSNLKMLFDMAAESSIICGIYERSGIYAIVEDNRVDSFIKAVGAAYERKIGKRPDFYVCAAATTKAE